MSARVLLILPLLICFAAAIAGLLFRRHLRPQRYITLGAMGSLFATSLYLLFQVHERGILVTQAGGWQAPFGITLVADHLSAIMVAVSAFVGLAVAIYALKDIDSGRIQLHFHPLFNILMTGICGAFLTGDLFNLYVWFEVLLIASFILMALGNERLQLEAALKYAAINLVGSTFFLVGLALIYGLTGTLNMADLAVRLPALGRPGLVTSVSMFFVVAFGIKAAIFPLFFWLPASYHTPPVSVSAIFSGLLTKVGVYALIRAFTLLFVDDVGYTHTLLLWLAALTMITGVLGAAAQHEFRRILSFHIISQIGYMIMGLALFTPLSLIGTVFYIVHHIIVKTNLFLVSGAAAHLSGTFELKGIGGLWRRQPLLSFLFIIPAFSLAGFPPLSGFWAKVVLVKAALAIDEYLIVAVALIVGLMTLFSMSKIWLQAFLPDPIVGDKPAAGNGGGMWVLLVPIALLVLGTLFISFNPRPLYLLAESSATELLNPQLYIEAVLGHE